MELRSTIDLLLNGKYLKFFGFLLKFLFKLFVLF